MFLRFLGSLVLLVAVVGCGGGEPKVSVSGAVRHNDQPLAGVNVVMIRTDGTVASATTDANGEFTSMTTDAPGDGAPPGQYKVAITPATTVSDQPAGADAYAAPPPPPFPTKYLSAESSGLQVTVEQGMEPLQLNLTN